MHVVMLWSGELGGVILHACLETAKTLWEQVSAILNCGINISISGFTLQWIVLDLLIMLVVSKVLCRAYEITLAQVDY